MMGACLSGDGASEASEDNNPDVESTVGDLESDWYLDVARQVASTTHTRSTVKARECTDHDFLWAAEFTTGRCRGKPIIWGMFHDKYTFERWTISHFADGGFDLDADPYEVGHDHELELVDDRSTLDQCDWPRGKSKYDARHFLRLY